MVAEVGPELPGGRARSTPAATWCMPGRGGRPRPPERPGPGRLGGLGHRHARPGGRRRATCAIDMPLNAMPPTLDGASFDAKVAAARGRARVDFALWGGLVPGALGRHGRAGRAAAWWASRRSCARAAWPEFAGGRPRDVLGRGMERAAALGLPVAVHAEDPAVVGRPAAQALAAGRRGMRDWCRLAAGRAPSCRPCATALALARETGCALHVVHLSSPEAVDLDRRGPRARGWTRPARPARTTSCSTRRTPQRIGAVAKCAPPLRSAAERAGLWRAGRRGRGRPRRRRTTRRDRRS